MKKPLRARVARLFVQATALLVSQLAIHAGPQKGAGNVNFPPVNNAEITRGQNAVRVLGAHLPDVARAYGLQREDLESLLLADGSLAVDHKGRLHFTDPAPDAATLTVDATVPEAALAPLPNTFKLHSRPGAKRIIYLDFDGHVISGTGWNTSYNGGRDIIAPAWDIDGNPASFSDTELTRIQQIWQRVAEDYAPFDVDVTTELVSESLLTRSSTSDEYYGTRVLISPISSYFGQYGGIAYVGAFDDVGDTYKPALVFPENLGPNGEKYVAEAASHEAGHNLGLSHDGTSTTGYYTGQGAGAVGWAPIMGAGYYEEVTQWSKGEYADANNKQDDLVVMQSYGLSYRADDHGNTIATASYFPAGAEISASGVIERNTDVDVFAFTTGAGAIHISITPSALGANLDIYAELRDANGSVLASSNPVDQLYASFDYSVPAGTYFLFVRGTGFGDPLTTGYSSYASLGQYFISGTVINPSGAVAPVANVTATPTSGTAPLAVQFNGSTSFDQDGTIVSYAWNFGDGATTTGAIASHAYVIPGTYTATLIVTDNTGLTGSQSAAIQVQSPTVNAAPIARITATPVSGSAPLNVTFDGTTSSDSDGSIVSYQWNFGDGATGVGSTIQHSYQSAGNYTATLTVTDNAGANASTTMLVQVTQGAVTYVRAAAISLAVVKQNSGDSVRATVKVTDTNGVPISGVTVNGSFSGMVAGSATAITDANGDTVLVSRRSKKNGTVTFTITGLAKNGYTYDAAKNLQTSASTSL